MKPTAIRTPWGEAVAQFGEPALKRGHSHQRVSNWRRDGVPGNIMTGLWRAKMNSQQAVIDPERLIAVASRLAHFASLPQNVQATLAAIQRAWEQTNGEGPKWRSIEKVLAVVAQMADDEDQTT